jgi:hypothetical protein
MYEEYGRERSNQTSNAILAMVARRQCARVPRALGSQRSATYSEFRSRRSRS